MRTRIQVAPGIYRDDYGYSVVARKGSGARQVKSPEHRFPLNTPLSTMVALWHREKMRLTDELARAGDGPVHRHSLAADVRQYLATATLTPRRQKEREQQLTWWCQQRDGGLPFGDRSRGTLETPAIRRVLAGLSLKGAASSTVNKYRQALSHVYTVLDGKSAPNPVDDAPKYDEPKAAMHDQPYWFIERIIDAIRDTGRRADLPSLTKARVRVLAYVPITPMQLRHLKRTDVDWARSEIITEGRKKGQGTLPRRKPVIPQGLDALKAFDAAEGWGIDFSRASLYKTFTAARDAVVAELRVERPDLDLSTLERMRPYDLRHSFATRVYQTTGDLAITGALLDHCDPQTTLRYAQGALPAHVAAAGAKVADAFQVPSTLPAPPPRAVPVLRKKRQAGQPT